MNNLTKSALWCHFVLGVALQESAYLYGFWGASAYGAIYILKIYRRCVTALVGFRGMRVVTQIRVKKLQNLGPPMALTAPWTERKEDL